MPLTDVQKPAKAELRRDAARRAFRDVLANVADGKLSVDIVADPVKGNVALITAVGPAARRDIEERIRERMKAFAFAYVVQWMA
jgi:hypothetical protein